MIKGKTKSGFAFEVDEKRIVGNYRYARAAVKLQTPGISDIDAFNCADTLLNIALGDEQVEKLLDHIEKVTGSTGSDTVFKEFNEIQEVVQSKSKTIKNS